MLYVTSIARAVTGLCTEKKTVMFFMNINEQTVSRNLKLETINTNVSPIYMIVCSNFSAQMRFDTLIGSIDP